MPNVRTINAGPSTVIHHIGSISHGGPFAWPSLAWVRQGGGNHRFDDPRGEQAQFTVLYGASEVEACFAELLDQFRPGHRWVRPALERIAPLPPGDPDNLDAGEHPGFGSRGFVPQDYLARRRIATLRIAGRARLLDVRVSATDTADALSVHPDMLPHLQQIGRTRIRSGDFMSNDRPLTQSIARWAHEHEFDGLVYTSPHDLDYQWTCWALFSRVSITEAEPPVPISPDDLALRTIASRFNLRIETDLRPHR